VLAVNVEPGLAFTVSQSEDRRDDDRMLSEISLRDILDRGGRSDPVDTMITEPLGAFTRPAGGVAVREVAAKS